MGFKFSVAVGLEPLAWNAPVPLRAPLEESAPLAAALGYNAVELHLADPAKQNAAEIREIVDRNGLGVSAVATGLELGRGFCLIDEAETKRRAAVRRLCEHVDFAAGLEAAVILGCVRGNLPDHARADGGEPYIGWLREGVAAICAHARRRGVTVMLEAINYYVNNYLNALEETAAFIHAVGSPALRLHIDTHHMNIEERDLPGAVLAAGKAIGYVHFSDSNRLYPGGGHIDFVPVIRALDSVGYTGYISMEIPPFPDGETAARRAIANTREYVQNSRT